MAPPLNHHHNHHHHHHNFITAFTSLFPHKKPINPPPFSPPTPPQKVILPIPLPFSYESTTHHHDPAQPGPNPGGAGFPSMVRIGGLKSRGDGGGGGPAFVGQVFSMCDLTGTGLMAVSTHFHLPFISKRKFEDRWVVRVTSEELAKNDKWAWRKYGQKPIKGSPYPRNYYRCSSMKGCKARKQVERSPMEPNIYVVTYTSHHLHPRPHIRNANNGSRVKFTGSDPYPHPKIESPTSIVPDPIRPWYGSEGHLVKIELVDEEVSGGANDESFGNEEVDESNNNFYYDNEILIPNSMADPELLTGMDKLSGSGG